MLANIKRFLQSRPVANVQQVADELAVDVETARLMLKRWVNKGCVRCLNDESACASSGRCGNCQLGCGQSQAASELYVWQVN